MNAYDDIEDALASMIVICLTYQNYDTSKSEWETHYEGAKRIDRLYRENINTLSNGVDTMEFLINLRNHIKELEEIKSSGSLVNP